ncbi:MAG: isoleucine--tRNA ligase [Clostridiales bacterium]|nr:isoleucine--tRNA ligase [Clostridiales bacterium]
MKKENASLNFVELEHNVLDKWKNMNLFHKIVDKNKNSEKRFRFLDGPMTANNRAGVHHFWGRILKDIIIKYHSMKGESQQFQNGFDAQGMWVEVNVEKALGLNGKPEIIDYGMDKFTEKCIERVNHFAGEITEQSKRMGQIMDWDDSYFTNSDENITSIWHFLKVCSEKGWLVKKNRPMVWCPRCGTSISEHELSGSYSDVTHTAIFFKLPVKNQDFKMVGWTTTPWTLCANVALAVNPELTYVKVLFEGEKLVLGKDSLKVLKGSNVEILEEFTGDKLVGLEYETCFPELEMQNFVHKIYPWDQVEAGEGACVVHIAPGCGAEDFELGKEYNLPEICPINEQGVMLDDCGFIAGKKTTDVVEDVVNRLKQDNKLLYAHKYKHSYPHCWRCKTDLVYKLISTWYIKMDEVRPQLLKAIDEVEFQPAYAKKRMEDWLNNMGDWNISRSRFYGLPLPIYTCEKCGKVHVVGSLEELKKLAVNPEKVDNIPHLHRPYIDEIQIKCDCGEVLNRIPEVGDCWLDAGITPFSTKKYFTDREYFNNNFPSDVVCEMIEQIKLWFYSLLVMSVVLTGKAPYKKIVTYQYVRDENGDEFHKSGGNSLDADHVADEVGAEAIRYLYASANPVNDMRFGYNLLDDVKKQLLAFWNIYVFFNTYAVIDNPKLDEIIEKLENNSLDLTNFTITDKWLLETIVNFTNKANSYYSEDKAYNVVKDFEKLIDDISNFYIRSNRKRFWDSDINAYTCLYFAIKNIIKVMAPIIPFITEHIWENLVLELEKEEVSSVHLCNFPELKSFGFNDLVEDIEKSREIIYLAQKLRNENKIKVKQPLSNMFLKVSDDYKKAVINLTDIIKEELNIKNIEFVDADDKFNTKQLNLNFKVAGKVLGGELNKYLNVLKSSSEAEMNEYVKEFETKGTVTLNGLQTQNGELFILKYLPKPEFAISIENNNIVALDITLTNELISEGHYREIVRQIQVARKEADFKIEDRIILDLTSQDEKMQQTIDKFMSKIMLETLAVENKTLDNAEYKTTFKVNEKDIVLKLKRV